MPGTLDGRLDAGDHGYALLLRKIGHARVKMQKGADEYLLADAHNGRPLLFYTD
jgi:hypothetical protein